MKLTTGMTTEILIFENLLKEPGEIFLGHFSLLLKWEIYFHMPHVIMHNLVS